MLLFAVGAVITAVSPTFVIAIVGLTIIAFGQGALMPLCFSVLGDLFEPAARARWSGLLAIPAGIAALLAPTLGGMITDTMNWSGLFWIIGAAALHRRPAGRHGRARTEGRLGAQD